MGVMVERLGEGSVASRLGDEHAARLLVAPGEEAGRVHQAHQRQQTAHGLFARRDAGRLRAAPQRVPVQVQGRGDAAIALGRSFLESGFTDEAIDTLHDVIENYELKGDAKSRDMYYWYGRALEVKGDTPAAQLLRWA